LSWVVKFLWQIVLIMMKAATDALFVMTPPVALVQIVPLVSALGARTVQKWFSFARILIIKLNGLDINSNSCILVNIEKQIGDEMNAALTKFLKEKNFMAEIFGGEKLTFPADRAKLKQMLEGDMSPENLTCDGELRGEALRARVAHLRAVEKALA
jgi:hypothetical protein